MDIVIEKGVPVPAGYGRQVGLTAVMRKMVVGDSIVVPEHMRASIYSIARGIDGTKFAVRKVADGQLRVWRTE